MTCEGDPLGADARWYGVREIFQELEEVPMTMVGGFDVHRKQITFDYVDDDGLVRWGADPAGDAGDVAALVGRALPRWGCGVRVGGLYWVAVCGRGVGRRRCGCASGGSGRDRDVARPEEARQDRPRRCEAVAHAAVGGPVPGVVDRAGARAGDPRSGPVVRRADGRAPGLAAAHPRPVVPPGLPAGHRPVVGGGPRGARAGGAVGGGTAVRGHRASPH